MIATLVALTTFTAGLPLSAQAVEINPGPGGAPAPCPPATPTMHNFSVTALPVPIIYNNWGDFDPYGMMFIANDKRAELLAAVNTELDRAEANGTKLFLRTMAALSAARTALLQTEPQIGEAVTALSGLTSAFLADQAAVPPGADPNSLPRPIALQQPLTVRARLGECVRFVLTNLANAPVSIHVHTATAKAGQGTSLGLNGPDLTLPGQTSMYVVHIPEITGMEGAHMIHSHADSRYQTRHGLFGSLVVEGYQTTWTNQQGVAVTSSQDAIIRHNTLPDFREFVLVYHDEVQLYRTQATPVDASLLPLPVIDEFQAYGPGTKAINYRSEPFMDRFREDEEVNGRHDKSQAYSSYTYGDPGVFIPRSYLGDPTKFRLVNAGPGQHHVHHLHGGGDRWRASPYADPNGTQFSAGLVKQNPVNQSFSERLDVQNIAPGESFNAEIEGGSGGVQQAAGDFLYHCHIVEHYVAGMWSFWRVYNTRQSDLAPLPDRVALPDPVTSDALLGNTFSGETLGTQADLDKWVRAQLPPNGTRAYDDASTWDWIQNGSDVYLGEPDDTVVWPNYASPTPGQRSPILFSPTTGRLAWPHLKPHLGDRPPFAPGHGPAPYLGEYATPDRPDGLCVPKEGPRDWERNYSIVAQSTRIDYNQRDKLNDGMVFAHAEDAPFLNQPGHKNATSLVIRANQGDCVNVVFASNLSDSESKVNMHIHLVQFDPQASDGVITGYSYEQSVKPTTTATSARLSSAVGAGAQIIQVDQPGKVRQGTWIGIGLLTKGVEVRRAVTVYEENGTIILDAPLAGGHAALAWVGPEFVRYKWYPDVELGVVYWHDHVDGVKGWQRGLFASLIVEPAGSKWCDPKRVVSDRTNVTELTSCDDVNDTHVLDIVNPSSPSSSFREIVLQFQDRACAEEPCNAGASDPAFPDRTTDVSTFNQRSANLLWRNIDLPFSSSAASVDPDFPGAQGDPATARTGLLRAYPGDDVRIRFVYTGQSDTTGVGTFSTPGHRFKFEHRLAESTLMDSLSVGISSQHNLRLDCGAGGCAKQPGDYLYGMSGSDQMDRGAWGIFRVHGGNQTDLAPLPSNVGWTVGDLSLPQGVQPKRFEVSAVRGDVDIRPPTLTRPLSYFVHEAWESAVVAAKNATPLTMRVREGDWVEVEITNKLPNGDKVSMVPSMVLVKPNESYGIVVGDNADTRVAPSTTQTFLWKADKPVGIARVASYGEMNGEGGPRSHHVEGLYGALVVEPSGSSFTSDMKNAADVTLPDGSKWREHVLLYASDDRQFFSSTMPYFTDVRVHPLVNYRTEPLNARVGGVLPPNAVHYLGGMGINSCQIEPNSCGIAARIDVRNPLAPVAYALVPPATPILDVTIGHGLVVRAIGAAGDQLVAHSIDGHWWASDPAMNDCAINGSWQASCKSNIVSTATLGPGQASNAWIPGEFVGKGGEGDYLWSNHRDPFREAGQWGILRVCGPEIGGQAANGTLGCVLDKLTQVGGESIATIQARFQEIQDMAQENVTEFQNMLMERIPEPSTIECLAGATGVNKVAIPPLALLANASGLGNPGFVPKCTAIPAAATVEFRHVDLQDPLSIPHDPGSARDDDAGLLTRCFSSSLHRPGDMTSVNQPFAVTFRWDPLLGKLFATPGLSPERDCTNAIDPAQSNSTRKVVPFQCDIHPNMVGVVVVATSGSTVGITVANPPAGPPNYDP